MIIIVVPPKQPLCPLNLSQHSLMVGSYILIVWWEIRGESKLFMFNQEHGFQDLIVTIDLQIPYSK